MEREGGGGGGGQGELGNKQLVFSGRSHSRLLYRVETSLRIAIHLELELSES